MILPAVVTLVAGNVPVEGRPRARPSIFGYREMDAGLTMFFLQYLVQAGVFFTIPLFLSVALGCRRWKPASAFSRCPSRCWPEPLASPGSLAGVTPAEWSGLACSQCSRELCY
jgi:hypothetical protein